MAKKQATPDLILGELLHRSPISRADLARETNLSRAAVTKVVDDLLALGAVEDNIPTSSMNGRKSTGIRLVLDDFYAVIVRINRRSLCFVLYDGNGDTIESDVVPLAWEVSYDEIVTALIDGIARLVDGRPRVFLLGISIAILGWLFEKDGSIIAHTYDFRELGKGDIREAVSAHFPDVPVCLEHDAKASALAEYHHYLRDTGVRPDCVLNIVGGIGFGGGIIINGEVFRGHLGLAGEVGHLGINFNSEANRRDTEVHELNGIFEDYASPRALCESVTSRLLDFPDTTLNEYSTAEDIYAAFDDGDVLAEWAVNRMAQLTAYGLAGLVFVLNPDVIVLGDRFPVSPRFLDLLRQHLQRYLPPILFELLDLRISKFGDEGVLYGAFLFLMDHHRRTNNLLGLVRRLKERQA